MQRARKYCLRALSILLSDGEGGASLQLKKMSVQETISLAVDTVSTFWNLSAAEKGLDVLQGRFAEVLQKS